MTRHSRSGSGIWFADDIENILTAVDEANLDVARHVDTPEMRVYRLGYEAAIEAIATAFGIAYVPKTPIAQSTRPTRLVPTPWLPTPLLE